MGGKTIGGILRKISGAYYDTLQNNHGCDSVIRRILVVKALPNASIGPDTMRVCDKQQLNFDIPSTTGIKSYTITNYSTTVNNTSLSFKYNLANYQVTVYAEAVGINGCTGSDKVTVLPNHISNLFQNLPVFEDPFVTFIWCVLKRYIQCVIDIFIEIILSL